MAHGEALFRSKIRGRLGWGYEGFFKPFQSFSLFFSISKENKRKKNQGKNKTNTKQPLNFANRPRSLPSHNNQSIEPARAWLVSQLQQLGYCLLNLTHSLRPEVDQAKLKWLSSQLHPPLLLFCITAFVWSLNVVL